MVLRAENCRELRPWCLRFCIDGLIAQPHPIDRTAFRAVQFAQRKSRFPRGTPLWRKML